jgi:type IV pilus assembly protein PilN
MLKINLLPVREARRKADLRQYFMQVLLVVLLTAGGIALVHSRMTDQIGQAQKRIVQMEADIEQFKPQLEQVAEFKKRKSELEKKIDVIDGLDKARSGPVRVMEELALRTPDRLWLKELRTKGSTVEIKGESLDNEIVALFLRSLGESPYFDKVDLDSTKLNADKGGLKVLRFELHADLVTHADADAKPAQGPGKGKGKGKAKAKAKAVDEDPTAELKG